MKIESRNTYLRPGADSWVAHTARSSGQQRFPRMHRFSIRSPSPLRAVVIIANCSLDLPRGIIYVDRATERFANPVSSSSLCSSGFSDRRHYRPLSTQVGCAPGENQYHLLFRIFDQDGEVLTKSSHFQDFRPKQGIFDILKPDLEFLP